MTVKDKSEVYPAVDVQVDRGSATGQILVWNDTTKRFEVTLTPSGLTSIGTGTLTLTAPTQPYTFKGRESALFLESQTDGAEGKFEFATLTHDDTDDVGFRLYKEYTTNFAAFNFLEMVSIKNGGPFRIRTFVSGFGEHPLIISTFSNDNQLVWNTDGTMTFGGNIIIPNDGLIGSGGNPSAIKIGGGTAVTVQTTFFAERDVTLNSLGGVTKLLQLTGPSGLYINATEEITTTPLTSGTMGYFELNTPGGILKPTSAVDFELPGGLTVDGTIGVNTAPTTSSIKTGGTVETGISYTSWFNASSISPTAADLTLNVIGFSTSIGNSSFDVKLFRGGFARLIVFGTITGTVSDVRGFSVEGSVFQGFESGPTVTNWCSFYAENPTLVPTFSGVGDIENVYGLLIKDITEGSVSNFAIKTGLGKVSFGDETTIGDGTNEFRVSATGGLVFVGTAGLVYGFIEGDHINWTQASAAQNTWYNISDADIVDRFLNLVTHDGNGKMTVTKAGIYWVAYNVSWEVNAANVHIEFGVEVNGSGTADTTGPHLHAESKFGNQESDSGTGALMDLAANSTIEVSMRTIDAGTPNFKVDNVHLTCYQIGGT